VQRNLATKVVRFDGTKIIPSAKSPYAIEVLVKRDIKALAMPRQPRFEGDNPFVDTQRGELYAVRVYNNSQHEAAVTLHIDGLSVFTFSEVRDPKGAPRYSHYIIPPGKDTTIHGWHKRNEPPDNFLSFLVTAYGDGASKLVAQPTGKVGLITATFAYAWPKGQEPPKDDRSAGDETGLGPPISAKFAEPQRTIGAVRDIVSIRYTR
jgi:hypothetical protein